ncbi:cytochrome p450-like protein [Trypanosoma rangeli]|uniref:Cytochrome p450-like protein n=1 Tax=Trypanosoma rangeli TaxID=5698 RepID=A0A422NNF0_TRYRA|nr:cytochrome p450-like protein [Trypanosoma rangeli]RNF07032.1 cytochrome p450-like protein [Trypanosoma rangeli]|eukprot:RNF07032.1 cytochrome p450-like protein [Trypanosoma rangeli]
MIFSIIPEVAFHVSGEDSVMALNAFLVITRFNKLNDLCLYYRTGAQEDVEEVLMKVSTMLMQRALECSGPQRWVVLNALINKLNVKFDKVNFISHLAAFFFEGQDATVNALHFLFALLTRDERVQQCLYEEILSVMPFTCICPAFEELMAC